MSTEYDGEEKIAGKRYLLRVYPFVLHMFMLLF